MQVAAHDGKNVCWTSEYSAEMRGGTALCRVVVADANEDIGSPYPDRLDILCCMTESAYDSYIEQVRDGGVVVVNSSLFGEMTDDLKNLVYLIILNTGEEGGISAHQKTARRRNFGYHKAGLAETGIYVVGIIVIYNR